MTPDERLEFLAGALERNAANPQGMRFSLSTWLMKWVEGQPESVPSMDCGTVGCAIGLAMLLPEFQAEGLEMAPMCFGYDRWVPNYCGYTRFSAVTAFFSIRHMEAEYLFHVAGYPRGKQRGVDGELAVAARIREFLAKRMGSCVTG